MTSRSSRWLRFAALAAAGALAVSTLLAALAALDNRSLPTRSRPLDRLSAAQKARLIEARRLQERLGRDVWPGWSPGPEPVVSYNEGYAFLVGYPDPPAGWVAPPAPDTLGGPWEIVPDDSLAGRPYHRQALAAAGAAPQAFTLRIGERWVASMPTLEWFRIDFVRHLRAQVPSPLRPVFPYRWVTDLFLGGSDAYVCLVAHEAFHALQGRLAPEHLAAAERAAAGVRGYPEDDAAFLRSWREELRLLATAVRAADAAEAGELARRFLAHRRERRDRFALTAAAADYERRREWLEGTAKYVELEFWRRAAASPTYRPAPALRSDPEFKGYSGFAARWSREIDQIPRSADDDVRFYYSGMAQAVMLDRLLPGWKERVLPGGSPLETLLQESLTGG